MLILARCRRQKIPVFGPVREGFYTDRRGTVFYRFPRTGMNGVVVVGLLLALTEAHGSQDEPFTFWPTESWPSAVANYSGTVTILMVPSVQLGVMMQLDPTKPGHFVMEAWVNLAADSKVSVIASSNTKSLAFEIALNMGSVSNATQGTVKCNSWTANSKSVVSQMCNLLPSSSGQEHVPFMNSFGKDPSGVFYLWQVLAMPQFPALFFNVSRVE